MILLIEFLEQNTILLFIISLILFLFLIKQIFDNRTFKKQIELLKKEKDNISFKMHIQEKMLFLQSRQASVGELIGNISHQWKEPLGGLGAILSNLHATLLLKGEVSNEKLSDSIEKSYKIIYHLSDTIATFYRFFKAQKSEKNDFNIYEEISNISLMVSYSMKVEQISLKFDCDKSFFLHGDRSEFANVILNIILNAKDILIERKIKEPLIELNVLKDDDNIIITIQDNGGGIYQEPIEKIFEYSVSSKENSTGIGLFIVRNIIENRMKGRIKVQNNAYGASFTIVLPITSNTIDATSILAYDVEESAYDKIARLEKEVAKQSEIEKALRQWEDIFTQTHWGVAVHKGTSNNFEMVNPAFCKMYGYSAKELNEIIIPDIVAPEYLEMWSVKQKEAFEKSFVSFEAVNIRKDGSKFPVNVDLTVIKNEYDEILYYIANVRDITTQKESQETLLLKEFALNQISEAVFLIDENSNFHYFNEAARQSLGYEENELRKLNVINIDPNMTQEKWEEHWNNIKEYNSTLLLSNHQSKDGKIFPIEVSANYFEYNGIGYNLAVARNITERLEVEKRKEDEKMRLFFERQIIGMAITSVKNGWVQTNNKLCEMLGYSHEELSKINWIDITHPDDLEYEIQMFNKLLIGEIDDYMLEKRVERKDKEMIYVNLVVSCVRHEDGSVDYILALLEDITERKLIEKELADSYNFLHQLIDSIPDPVFVKDREHRWVLLNETFCSFSGLSKDDLIGKSDYDVFPKEEADIFWEKDEFVFDSGEVNINEEYLTSTDGVRHSIETVKTMFTLSDGKQYLVGTIRDITERKLIQEKIEKLNITLEHKVIERTAEISKKEREFRTLAENMPDFLSRYDKEGRRIYVNPALCNYFGVSCDELVGFTPQGKPLIGVPKELQEKINYVLQSGYKTQMEIQAKKDGKELWWNLIFAAEFDEDGKIEGVISIGHDITEQKEITNALKKSEEAFRAMVENSPDVIMRYDRECRRTYINPLGLVLMGKSEEELLGKTPREFSPLPNLEEFEKAFHTVLTEAKEVKIEGEFLIPNGERRWGEQRIVPELNQEGEVVSVLVIGRDITELRKAHKELLFKNFAMENVNESIFLVDETGKFKYVNQGACKALGYISEELLSLSIGDIDPDWPSERWCEYWEILKQEKSMTMELRHKRKDGTIFPVEAVANYIEYEGIGYNMGLVRDISERKNAENEIKEREEKFSKLFMSSPAAVSVTSIDRNMYLEVNDSFLYFTKYTRDEVVGKSSAELQLFANLDERAEFFRMVLEDGMVRGFEFQYRAKDGTTGYGIAYATLLNIQGERCVLAHSYDINATKQLELVSTAINSTSEAVYITDETFSIIYVNDGACKMLGYTKEELTSMKVYEIDVLYSLEDLSTIKETKRLNQQMVFETKHKRKNGTIIDVEIAGGSFSFHNKTVFVSVVKDITAKKEYEKQLHLLQTAINNASDAIYIIGDNREIKYVSDTSCKMLGYSVDEFLTMKVEDIDPYMSVDEIIGVREKVKDFNSTIFQTQHRTKNGNILNVEITVTKFIFNDTVLNLSIVKDITRQIRQEEEIRELNKTLEVKVAEKTKELEKALQFNESIIQAIPDMLFEISKECVYLNIWARDEKLLAQQKEILLGKSFKDMLPPDAVEVSVQTMREVDMYGSSLGNTYKLDFPDGEHWFELHTTKKESDGNYLALVRDITERKKAQNALVELNSTLEEKIEERTKELKKALDVNNKL